MNRPPTIYVGLTPPKDPHDGDVWIYAKVTWRKRVRLWLTWNYRRLRRFLRRLP